MSDGTWKYGDRIYKYRVELETLRGTRIFVLTDKKDLSYQDIMDISIMSDFDEIQRMQEDNLIVEEWETGK